MNISSIQAGQLSQNAIRPIEKGDYAVDAGFSFSSAQGSSEVRTPQVSTQGITSGINYLQEQLRTLLASFPPFFPAGSPQRLDLITKIKGLEGQIGKSSIDENLKKVFSNNKMPEHATDQEISVTLDRLFGLRDTLEQTKAVSAGPVKPGTIVNVQA